MAEGAVDQRQGPSILVHGVSLRADVPCIHAGCINGGNTGLFTSLQTVPRSQTHQCHPVPIQYTVVQYSYVVYMYFINHNFFVSNACGTCPM